MLPCSPPGFQPGNATRAATAPEAFTSAFCLLTSPFAKRGFSFHPRARRCPSKPLERSRLRLLKRCKQRSSRHRRVKRINNLLTFGLAMRKASARGWRTAFRSAIPARAERILCFTELKVDLSF
jgi:hypothetical protein